MVPARELIGPLVLFLGLGSAWFLVSRQQRRLSAYSNLHLIGLANNNWHPAPIWDLRARFRMVGARTVLASRGWEVVGNRHGRLIFKQIAEGNIEHPGN